MNIDPVLEQILDLARWAPSGDNTQPWRFEILGDRSFAVHGFDTRDHCVYDLQGHASQLSLGALLETIAIAATGHALRAEFHERPGQPEERPVFDVTLLHDPELAPDPLIPFITVRSVQRRPMSMRKLRPEHQRALEAACGPDYEIRWYSSLRSRLAVARLLFLSGKLRLTMREAYETHRRVIEWGARYSVDRIPDQALGVDRLTLRLMRWAMQSWERVDWLNRYAAGSLVPRLLMDALPALACATHYSIHAPAKIENIIDVISAGRVIQRLWLVASFLGLSGQPQMTPIIFTGYVIGGVKFCRNMESSILAGGVAERMKYLTGDRRELLIWFGRFGYSNKNKSRSLRKSLIELIVV